MDIESIKIKVDTSDLLKAKTSLESVETQAKKTDKGVSGLTDSFFSFKGVSGLTDSFFSFKGVSGLTDSFFSFKGAIASFSAMQLASQFIKTADAMNNLDSRLKLATKSTADYNKESQRLVEIAKGSYTSISDTMTLFTKLSPALEKVGANTDQVNSIVQTFQKGLQLGGASVEESKSAILQFAQAMGSGALRGDEFNSMAEASPKLMEYMARGLGVAQTSLRKMAAEGELTAEKVANALLSVKDSVEKDFVTMPVTVGKAMTNLQTDLTLAVKDIDYATGASNALATSILSFSKNIGVISGDVIGFYKDAKTFLKEHNEEIKTSETIIKSLAGAYLAFAVTGGIVTGITNITAAVTALRVSMLALEASVPVFGWIAAAVGAMAGAWIYNNDLINRSNEEAMTIMNDMNTKTELLAEKAKLAKEKADIQGNKFMWDSDQRTLVDELNKKLEITQTKLDAINKASGAFDIIPKEELSRFDMLMGKLDEYDQWKANKAKDKISGVAAEWKDLPLQLQKVIDGERVIRDEYDKYRQTLKDTKNDTPENLAAVRLKEEKDLADYRKKQNADSVKEKKAEQKAINDLSKEYSDFAKLGMTDYEKKLYTINLEYVDFIKKGGDVATGLALLADGEKKLNEETAKSKLEERNKALDKQLAYDKSIFELKEKQVGLLDDENEKNRTLSQLYHDRQVQEIKAMAEKEPRNDDFYQKSLQYEDELLQKNLQRYSVTGQIIEEVGSGMKSTMMDFFDYTSKGFGDMRKMVIDVGNMIYQAIVKQMVVNPLVSAATSAAGAYFATPAVSGSATASNASTLGIQGVDSNMNSLPESIRLHAKGGVYGSNSLGSYRNGVYDSPQLFAFAKGGTPNMGVFGEAGSEAIMPLTRDSSGSLGVKAVGSGSQDVKVEIINKGTNEMQVTNATSRNDISGQVISIVIDGIVNNKQGLRTIMGGR